MSTPRRMFEDPRNTYVIENNDPEAFDKRFVNRPGVHREQQCCRNRAPVWQTHLLDDGRDPASDNPQAYLPTKGLQVDDATGQSDNVSGPQETKGRVWVQAPDSPYKPDFISPEEWMRWQGVYWMSSPNSRPDLPNPPRWVRMSLQVKVTNGSPPEFLWCPRCETWLESAWSEFLDILPVAARIVAMAASYVPVFGTAVSFVINTTVSLAEGEKLDQALLDGIGGALPGQPASGMAFNACVAVGRGERVDEVFINSLPLDQSIKTVILAADQVVYAIATGQNITGALYETIRESMPAEAQLGMDYARRVINGENVAQMVLSESEQLLVQSLQAQAQAILTQAQREGPNVVAGARARVESMFNQYAVECGYQMALDRAPAEGRGAVQLGLLCGASGNRSTQYVGTFAAVRESNTVANDAHYYEGRRLIGLGIIYRYELISQILRSASFTIVVDQFDQLSNTWIKVAKTYAIADPWRRGFTIAIGVCEGSSIRGPGQTGVYQSMAEGAERDGFDAGQAVQFYRTLHGEVRLAGRPPGWKGGQPVIDKITPKHHPLNGL